MMNWYTQEKLAIHRVEQMAREAEQQWQVREALQGQREHVTIYDRALAGMGRWLVERGTDLQERHGDVPALALYVSTTLQGTTYKRS
jgi:aminoglycoside phosphotransferase